MPSNLKNPAVAIGLEKVSFHSNPPKKAMPKNIQTILQLYSLHMLASLCSKFFILGFSSTRTENFQMYKLSFEEAEESEIKLPTYVEIMEKAKEFKKKTSISSSLTMLKPLTVWITTNCGKFLKRWDDQIILPVS